MSSDRIERKRKSESDTSDNSADEQPAVKIRRLDSAISIGKKVSEACKYLLNWITPDFVKKMAVRVSHQRRMGSENSYSNQHPIDVEDDDDEEECTVVSMQNGTGALARSESASTIRMDSQSKSTRPRKALFCPRTSTPFSLLLSPDNPYYKKVSQTVERKKMNGYPVGAETDELRRSRRSEKCIAPITNPRSEIDILLEKDKEVEIINEVYPAKHSSGPTRKTRLLSETRSARSNRTNSTSDFVNNSARSSYVSRSYTANEVVRLQEKAQYTLLLEKVVKRVPLFQPAFPKESSQTSALQVDLTEDDDISSAGCHFKKEKVAVNVNDFLNKYYKPCTLVSRAANMESLQNHPQSLSERVTSKDDDDEIQIIEYPELPKLKPRKSSVKNGGLFSPDWIAEMKQSMMSDTEKMLQTISENEDKVQRFKKRREARNAEEMRKREEQRLAGFIFDDDFEMEEETLPEITPEMNEIIDRAFAQPGGDKLSEIVKLSTGETLDIKPNDITTLANINWLNDEVINFYIALIENRSGQEGYPTTHCFSSFFYPRLKKGGPNRQLLRWTRKTDIFAKDLIIVPLHLEMHWALLVVDNRSKVMRYYDSIGGHQDIFIYKLMEQYLITEMQDKKKAILEPNTYSTETPQDIPRQMNGSDCGMFTLKYAEYLSRDAPLTFTQENMPYFRRRMVYEIIAKKIL